MKKIGIIIFSFLMILGTGLKSPITNVYADDIEISSNSSNVEISNDSESSTSILDSNTSSTIETDDELIDLINKWLNGEIELDDATLQKIYEKLSPISQEQIDKFLEKYIEDQEERLKVSSIIMGVLAALCTIVAISIFLRRIIKEGKTATINNETIKKSSEIIKEQTTITKEKIDELTKTLNNNSDLSEKLNSTILTSLETINNGLKAIMGILQITFYDNNSNNDDNIINKEGVKNEQKQQEKAPKK